MLMPLVVVVPSKVWLGVSTPWCLALASPALWLAERQIDCFVPVPVVEAELPIAMSLLMTTRLVVLSVRMRKTAAGVPLKAFLID